MDSQWSPASSKLADLVVTEKNQEDRSENIQWQHKASARSCRGVKIGPFATQPPVMWQNCCGIALGFICPAIQVQPIIQIRSDVHLCRAVHNELLYRLRATSYARTSQRRFSCFMGLQIGAVANYGPHLCNNLQ